MHHASTDRTDKHSSAMGVVLLAAAAGAVIGMMYAPKRGTEMREDLKGKYNDMKNKTQDTAATAKEKVNQQVETARNKVHDMADKSKATADKAADKAKEATADKPNPGIVTPEEIATRSRANKTTTL